MHEVTCGYIGRSTTDVQHLTSIKLLVITMKIYYLNMSYYLMCLSDLCGKLMGLLIIQIRLALNDMLD